MTIHELFEQHYAEQHDESPEWIKGFRMRNGSYALANISTAFRYFKAGFEANQGEKMQVLGYLSKKETYSCSKPDRLYFSPHPTAHGDLPIYVKHCDALNKGSE